jgi:hypothetical protein
MRASDAEAAQRLVSVCFQLFDWDLTGNESIGSLLSPALSVLRFAALSSYHGDAPAAGRCMLALPLLRCLCCAASVALPLLRCLCCGQLTRPENNSFANLELYALMDQIARPGASCLRYVMSTTASACKWCHTVVIVCKCWAVPPRLLAFPFSGMYVYARLCACACACERA